MSDGPKKAKNMHALRRTSAFGVQFVGFCTKCGKRDLRIADMQTDECVNPFNESPEQSLLNAIHRGN